MRLFLFMLPRILIGVCLKNTLEDISGGLRDEGDLDSLGTTRVMKKNRQTSIPACETTNATDRKEIQLGEAGEGQGWEGATEEGDRNGDQGLGLEGIEGGGTNGATDGGTGGGRLGGRSGTRLDGEGGRGLVASWVWGAGGGGWGGEGN